MKYESMHGPIKTEHDPFVPPMNFGGPAAKA